MDELHGLADKLFAEVHHLDLALDSDDLDAARTALALAAAKRVKRDSGELVRLLAQRRDACSRA